MEGISVDHVNDTIKEKVLSYKDEFIRLRRKFHQCPELGFCEFNTSKMIAEYLRNLELDVKEGVGGTGVVADINPEITDTVIALRVDMDALAIKEETNLPYISQNEGMMHACGHDGHITIGLGTAKVLSEIKAYIPAHIRLIFQPAEEGLGGAKRMVSDGVLEDIKIQAVIGLHIQPIIPLGKIGVKVGPVMAMGDGFSINIYGSGGHGSAPQSTIDPIVIAAEVITSLQKIVSRNIDPCDPAVISIGSIHSGNAFNVIPGCVEIKGTTRSVSEETRDYMKNRMEEIIKSVTEGNRGTYEFNYEKIFKLVINDKSLVGILEKTVGECSGKDSIMHMEKPLMVSEDFSEYTENIPGTYFFIGTGNQDGTMEYPLHHSHYSIDERVLSTGVLTLASYAVNICRDMKKI